MTATACAAARQAIVDRYVLIVRGNTVPGRDATAAVLADIADGGWEVVTELLEVSWMLELRSASESEATQEAWLDAMFSALPAVAKALKAGASPLLDSCPDCGGTDTYTAPADCETCHGRGGNE